MRSGEVLGLTWQHVDLEGASVRVERALARYDGAYHLVEPKTVLSRRTIAIPAPVVAALRAHRVRQLTRQLESEVWEGNAWGLVFTDELGRPLHNRTVRHRFDKLPADAGVRHVRFHDLRHGAATFLLAQGVLIKVVQDVLGHAQIAITADLYSHVVPELRRNAADKMGDVLFGGA